MAPLEDHPTVRGSATDPPAPDPFPDPFPDPSVVEVADIAEMLGVDPAVGLDAAEAARRLAADGPNELRGTPPVPAWRRFVAQFQDPLIYLLFVAIAISLVAWALEGADGVPVDAVVIAAIVAVNAIIDQLLGEDE